ncbi:amidohydrolase family protein [Saccharopolyspora hattusasensis]|uniref:amidohydrolase family protein n=1 Tax=Saccharopolyspora hattusasensis TaxID=1128679 RepID=UPI003D956582
MSTVNDTARHGTTVLRASRLFDGETASPVDNPVVILEGTTIAGIGCAADLRHGETVVDFPGATLIPGLIDPHVHLAFDASSDPVKSLAERDDDAVVAAMRIAATTALRAGITTIRDLGDRDFLSLALRGAADLPTIVAAGPPLTTVEGHCHFLGGEVAHRPAELRAAVRAHVERGVDVVKIMASGGTMTPGSLQEQTQFDREALRAAVSEAHRHGIPVTAHAHGHRTVLDAIEAGVDGVEHVTFWATEGVDTPGRELVERIVSQRVALGATAGVLPRTDSVMPAPVSQRMPAIIANFAALYAAGAVIVAGTDAGIGPYKPHDVLPYAQDRLAAFGMDPVTILRSMTSVAAGVCGLGHRKGRLRAGYDADVVVVQGDPNADLSALHRVVAVYSRGTRVDPGSRTTA